MSIRTILVPVEPGDHLSPTVRTAVLLGRACDGHIAGIGLGISYMVVGPMGGMVVTTRDIEDQPQIEDLRGAFRKAMAEHRVEPAEVPTGKLAWGWQGDEVITDAELGGVSRIFDVTVAGRPDPDAGAPRLATIENVLFEGGRPVLLAPPTPPAEIGRTILIAWNCSTETARAVSFAMPLLEAAGRVHVLTVEGATVIGPSGAALCTMLKAHGIEAAEKTMEGSVGSAGEAILRYAREQGCDLIVKGAYSHSRLRQMVFGGPTSYLIHKTDLPLFLAT